MSFSIGIVGLPNVGKSTLFKALTKQQVDASNYPFCTIDPNVGVVKVPDERLTKLHELFPSSELLPTTIEFVDIAGLVKGASEGEGLGNKFLENIRGVDAIAQVVRNFTNDNITHVSGKIDPENDAATINLELILADLSRVDKRLDTARSAAKAPEAKFEKKLVQVLEKIQVALNNNQPASSAMLDNEEQVMVKDLRLLTMKPMLYVMNISEDELAKAFKKPAWLPEDAIVIRISAKVEAELTELEPDETMTMLNELGLQESGLDQLIKAGFKILNLITFLTSGPKETRAWTIEQHTKAPQAAAVIHTDFEKHFIRVEVIDWKDLYEAGSEAKARELGKIRTEGKEYIMRDGDVCHFLVNV